jgi:large subunit ribosomal protein L25
VSEVKLTAEQRSEFGKGAARRLRRAHKVPAVLYGHGTDPVHIALEGHATMLALKNSNALLSLEFGEGRTELALPKDVQRDPVRGHIEHVDLLLVRRGEEVTVDVPVHVDGQPEPGTLVALELTTLSLLVDATKIPNSVSVSIEGAGEGTQIHAGQIELPEGSTLATDPEALVLHVSVPAAEVAADAAAESESSTESSEAASVS